MNKNQNKSETPVNVLIDDFKSEDIKKRMNSVQSLSLISQTLGIEKTKSELIPFLDELLLDEDQLLVVLIDSLHNLVDLLGPP